MLEEIKAKSPVFLPCLGQADVAKIFVLFETALIKTGPDEMIGLPRFLKKCHLNFNPAKNRCSWLA